MGNELKDIGNEFKIHNTLFYDLCARANSVCSINYDKISLVDLLGFVAIAQRQTYKDIKVNNHINSKRKQQAMANKMLKGRI